MEDRKVCYSQRQWDEMMEENASLPFKAPITGGNGDPYVRLAEENKSRLNTDFTGKTKPPTGSDGEFHDQHPLKRFERALDNILSYYRCEINGGDFSGVEETIGIVCKALSKLDSKGLSLADDIVYQYRRGQAATNQMINREDVESKGAGGGGAGGGLIFYAEKLVSSEEHSKAIQAKVKEASKKMLDRMVKISEEPLFVDVETQGFNCLPKETGFEFLGMTVGKWGSKMEQTQSFPRTKRSDQDSNPCEEIALEDTFRRGTMMTELPEYVKEKRIPWDDTPDGYLPKQAILVQLPPKLIIDPDWLEPLRNLTYPIAKSPLTGETGFTLKRKKCECGAHSTLGLDCPARSHSSWCDFHGA